MDVPREPPALDPALRGLEPVALWEQFDAIRRIPRMSHEEEGVRRYLRALAKRHGWAVREDAGGNVVLVVPGRGRGVEASPVAIQGHGDMGGAKEPDSPHDFLRDPIELRRDTVDLDDNGRPRDVLLANDTTLGSDNGIGCAAGLAIALTPGLDHPPLELLFTANEETGMSGAENLDPKLVVSRRMLNLDTEEWGSVYISCAGGRDLHARWSVEREAPRDEDVGFVVQVRDLKGGHSGVDIHNGRTNGIKLMVDLVLDGRVELDGVRLGACDGGGRPNAIPRDGELVLWCPRSNADAFETQLQAAAEAHCARIAETDPHAKITVRRLDADDLAKLETRQYPIGGATGRAIVKAIGALDDGVIAWSTTIEGLVETSSNLGVITTREDEVEIVIMTRSSKDDAVERVQTRMDRTLQASGADVSHDAAYPGWEADPESPLLQATKDAYERLFGEKAEIKAIHAGLECGILGQRLPGVSMVSFGPEIRNAHTPQETLVLDTVPPFFELVAELVRQLCDR